VEYAQKISLTITNDYSLHQLITATAFVIKSCITHDWAAKIVFKTDDKWIDKQGPAVAGNIAPQLTNVL